MNKTDQNDIDSSALELNGREKTVETILRVASMALSLAGLVIMIKNSVSNDFGSLSYSDLGAFMYLVNANGVCATILFFFCSANISHSVSNKQAPSLDILLFDQVVTYVVLAAGTVSAETLYLAYRGNKTITWSSGCESFGVFCHKALVSVLFTFVVSILYMSLSFISSYKLFSRFEAL